MSDTPKDVNLSLRAVINKEKTKVLFAEAGSDFADVLLSFLTLPLGRIVKLLEKHYPDKSPVFGSITSLYKSLANLDEAHFTSTVAKLMLLDPRGSFDTACRKLKVDISESQPTNYYTCDEYFCCLKPQTILMYHDVSAKCICGKALDKEGFFRDDSEEAGVFTVDRSTSFIVYDDLRMVPYSTGFISALTNLGITDARGLELRNFTLGIHEIMDLLKCCLFSNTPLSDFFLKGEISPRATPTPELGPGYLFHQIKEEETSNSNKKATLKVIVQKSTKKLLFAQADNDFIELLASFLIIPIAGVESLLDANTRLMNFDNLYRSITDVGIDKHFITLSAKHSLMNPAIPLFYLAKNTFPNLKEEFVGNVIYYHYYQRNTKPSVTFSRIPVLPDSNHTVCSYRCPRGKKSYVKEPTMYMVTDDLTVAPFYLSESFSIFNQLNIPLSDVVELEMPVGLQEGLSILKASLSSRTALTDGLMQRICIE